MIKMKREIFVNVEKGQERLALVENEDLVEFYVSLDVEKSLVGDIYIGFVQNVLPGIQSAFVDVGRQKNAFLHISDIETLKIDADEVDSFNTKKQIKKHKKQQRIEKILNKGQKLMRQITKEAIGTKGPKATTNISIPGNFVVLLPYSKNIGVSRKIRDKKKRKHLYKVAKKYIPKNMGVIMRTASENREEKDIRNELNYIVNIWKDIVKKYKKTKKKKLLYRDLETSEKIIRDNLAYGIDRIVIDDKKKHNDVKKIFKNLNKVKTVVENFDKDIPIFDTYGIESAIDKGISKVVDLDCGGTLVFDEAEALVAIDINTGHFVGKKSQEETIFTTNMEAAKEIPRQLRLRDIGGIIIIDFIDMERKSNRNKVFQELKKNLKRDKAETNIYPLSELGLVEMTRKRVKKSLKKQITQSCPYCKGAGFIYSNTSQIFNIIRTLRKAFWISNEKEFLVILNHEIFYSMINEYRDALDDLEEQYERKIYLSYSDKFHHNDIKIVSLQTKKEILSNLNTYEEDNEVIF